MHGGVRRRYIPLLLRSVRPPELLQLPPSSASAAAAQVEILRHTSSFAPLRIWRSRTTHFISPSLWVSFEFPNFTLDYITYFDFVFIKMEQRKIETVMTMGCVKHVSHICSWLRKSGQHFQRLSIGICLRFSDCAIHFWCLHLQLDPTTYIKVK